MTHRLACRPEQELPVALLRLTGVLDQATAPALRAAIRCSLVGVPDGVVVDVSGLDVRDTAALAVFPAMAQEASMFPAAPLMLCGDAPQVDTVPVFPTRERALDELRARPVPPRLRAVLRPVPDACRQARRFVAQACVRWQVGDLVGGAAVVVTELVANVVRHARTGMELTLGLRDGRLCIAVRDRCAAQPSSGSPSLHDTGGRGLLLVRELADAWGVLPGVDGKVVWAALSRT